MHRRRICTAVSAALTALVFAGATQAASPPPATATAYVEEVAYEQPMSSAGRPIGPKVAVSAAEHSPDATALAVAGGSRGRAPAGTSRSLQASGCKTVWATRIGRSLLGFVTYKYTQEKYFCWSSPRVTTVQVSAYPCCTDPTWFYRGPVASAGWYFAWSGDSRGGHYSLRQGRFEQSVLGKIVNSAQPWVKLWVYGNGGWSYATGV
jgi:hypothetical protein